MKRARRDGGALAGLTMIIQYRYIDGRWQTFRQEYLSWAEIDYHNESYWFVPGTFSQED